MKVVCSSRDDRHGVGSILVLTVNSQSDIQVTDETIFITDTSGEVYEVYDYIDVGTNTRLLCQE